MPSVKITELPVLSQLSANNANTVFVAVDKTTNTTSQFSTTTLAGGLFANNVLNVGTQTPSTFPGLIAQFIANTAPYGQVNFENANTQGSMDVVLTADIGDDANNYVDLGINNSGYADPQFSSMKAADGYLMVFGTQGDDYVGNLVIGTAAAETNVVFSVGGTTNLDVVAKMTKNGLEFDNSGYITFDDGSTQTVAASPASVTLAAQANTIITQGVDLTQNTRLNSIETVNVDQNTAISIIQGVDLTQNAQIIAVNNYAASGYAKANAALANTTGTFAGDFTATGNITSTGGTVSTGNLSVGGTTVMIGNMTSNGTSNLVGNVIMSGTATIEGFFNVNNSTFSANTAMMRMTASDDYAVVSPSNSYYMLHITGKSNNVTRVVLDSFGANTYPLVSGRMGRGSAAAPAATANNDVMMRIVGNGYTGTQFPASSPTKIDFVATENFSNTNRGTRIEFWNTPAGSNNIQRIATFNANEVQFTGVLNPQKGFIYTPIEYPGAQTAITIDFANNSLLRCNTSTGVTVSFTNYTAGKVVELWITNTAGTGQTFTHGCAAINSTVNSTTYNIPATSSILARYYSFDAALANTFVSIVHA